MTHYFDPPSLRVACGLSKVCFPTPGWANQKGAGGIMRFTSGRVAF